MIPMVVAQQQINGCIFLNKALAKHANPCARVEDDIGTILKLNVNACSITTIADVSCSRGRD